VPTWRNRYSGRVIAAVATPVVAISVGATLVLAGPASAVGTSSTPPPFPTSICGTGGLSPSSTQSSSSSASASATTQPSATASSPSASSSASPSPSASASSSTPAAGANQPASPPSASPSASTSATSSGGFFGWLNGIWTWITGDDKLLHAGAAPVVRAGGVGLNADDSSTDPSTSDTASASATCVPSADLKSPPPNANANGSCSGDVAAQTPWVMESPSVVMYDLTYNGVTTIPTFDASDGKCDTSLTVLSFTMSEITIDSMVTYSHVGDGMLQYNNGGKGETTTLTNVQLYVTSMQANILGLIGADFTPTSTPTLLLGLLQGFTVPIPLLFTDVTTNIAFLNSGSIAVPGFAGYGTPDS
jgi:hypothetical protein